MAGTSITEMPSRGLATNAVRPSGVTATSCGSATDRDAAQHLAGRRLDERQRAGVPEEHEQTRGRLGVRGGPDSRQQRRDDHCAKTRT